MAQLSVSLTSLRIYFQWRLIAICLLGFASGLPLALTMGTLSLWLAESHIDKATIGIFALVGLPYSIKFLWAPVIDHLSIPLLSRILGRRRSWMLLTQVLLGASIFSMGRIDPLSEVGLLSIFAVVVAFFSASQDVVIDAFRIELLDEKTYGAGAAMVVLGYRLGMITSSAGALFLASYLPWNTVYALMALCVGIGMITVLFCKEPSKPGALNFDKTHSLRDRLRNMTVGPFVDFMKKPQWLLILFFVVFYKLGDAFLGHMVNPFYLELGFSKIEIASVSKIFGIGATILGGFAGGIIVLRLGMMRALLVCGVLQVITILVFAVLALIGHNVPFLMFTIGAENFASGMGTAAFVAYISSLCTLSFTASQYALLSAFSSFGRTFLTAGAGYVAESTTWPIFFVISSLVAVPGLLALLWLMRVNRTSDDRLTISATTS